MRSRYEICSDIMGLNKQYIRVGQSAKNRLFGIPPVRRGPSLKADRTPLQMLVSNQGDINHGRLAVVCLGLFALALGILMSTIPWVDYIILKQLRLWNGTLSYYYWRQPGVNRLTKVWVFNVTNPDGFLNNQEKPRLEEIGPFVYKEDMEKVNIQFHDNGTVSFQHKKILQFVPELSYRRDVRLIVPNIPLLTLTSMLADRGPIVRLSLGLALRSLYSIPPLLPLTPDELLFGFDEPLTALAHRFYPKNKRPPRQMGLLIGRNQSLIRDVETIYTGHTSMNEFGLLHKLNGMENLPYWDEAPCNSIRASEGSLFPPRDVTHDDVVHVFDKDLCRIWPLRYRHDDERHGIKVGKYTPDDNIFMSGDKNPQNKCFCPGSKGQCPPDGLQDVSPCHFNAPVFLSKPHFYGMEPSEVTDAVEGLTPSEKDHESVLYLQPKLGVPLEAKIRVQLNLKVKHSSLARTFPSITFPIAWVEEGAEEIPDYIIRWIYMATTLAQWGVPLFSYITAALGATILVFVFVKAYRTVVFSAVNLERGKATLRRGSSFFVNGQHRLLILRDSYTLLQNQTSVAETAFQPDPMRDSD